MKKKRSLDIASLQYQYCLTSQEIINYKTGDLSPEARQAVFHHLNIDKCLRCRELYLSLSAKHPSKERDIDLTALKMPRLNSQVRSWPGPPEKLVKGQIWTTDPEPRDSQGQVFVRLPGSMPVLIIHAGNESQTIDNIIRVLPISLDIDFHCQPWTFFLKEESSPLGYSVLIEIFNERPMLAGNLKAFRGGITPEVLEVIEESRNEFIRSELEINDRDIKKWQDKEIEMAGYLSKPVNAMLWADGVSNLPVHDLIDDQIQKIHLVQYASAAKIDEISLEEITPHVLAFEEHFSLTLVQKRDHVFIQFQSDTEILDEISINKEHGEIIQKEDGLWEIFLGSVDRIPNQIELRLVVRDAPYLFHLQFF
jgi:hypothetical protein